MMRRRLTQVAIVFVAGFAVAQLIRPERTNPPIDTNRTIQAHVATPRGLVPVLDRSCGDCHSNATVWSSWYARIAPPSWLMAREVAEGRKAINFSEWAAYTPEQQRVLLNVSCEDAKSGKMPGPYTLFKPDTRLSAEEVETICRAARQNEAKATEASR